MQPVFKTIVDGVAILSLMSAILAFLPSIAPFTPALLLSVISFIGAIIGILSGWWRVAILTIYIVCSTFLVSPIFSWIEEIVELGLLVYSLLLFNFILAVGLFLDYRKSDSNTLIK